MPTPSMNPPMNIPARFPLSGAAVLPPGGRFSAAGGLFGRKASIPRGMGWPMGTMVSLPATAGWNPRAWVSNPVPMGANPFGAVSIPGEMGCLPKQDGIHPGPRGMAPIGGNVHPAAGGIDTIAGGINTAGTGSEPGRGGTGAFLRNGDPGARSGALECGGKRSATPLWQERSDGAGAAGRRHPKDHPAPPAHPKAAWRCASRRTPRSLA